MEAEDFALRSQRGAEQGMMTLLHGRLPEVKHVAPGGANKACAGLNCQPGSVAAPAGATQALFLNRDISGKVLLLDLIKSAVFLDVGKGSIQRGF